jgi:hypothetical protein
LIKVNGVPLPQLAIRLRDGQEHTFLTGRPAEELAWIADELSVACGCFPIQTSNASTQQDAEASEAH